MQWLLAHHFNNHKMLPALQADTLSGFVTFTLPMAHRQGDVRCIIQGLIAQKYNNHKMLAALQADTMSEDV